MTVIFNQRVEVLRAGLVKSPYSTATVEDWSNPQVIGVEFPVSVQPAGSTESEVERPTVNSGWRLITPPGTDLDLRASDRIRIGGMLVMEVQGNPEKWPDPFRPGRVHHVEASLGEVNG